MDNLSVQMKARLDKWRNATGKSPETIAIKKKLSGKASMLKDYESAEKDYWNLELENEGRKRKK